MLLIQNEVILNKKKRRNLFMSYAQIIPLIGGLALGMQKAFDELPKYVVSFDGFQGNDKHYINYLRSKGWTGNYITVDKCTNNLIDGTISYQDNPNLDLSVDIVGCLAPCAGLSSLSPTSKADSPVNDWMYKSSQFILETVKPKIFWGENSIFLASKKGEPVAKKLAKIGKDNGYNFLIYATENRLHGNPQKRARTFYFYFKNDVFPKNAIPLLKKLDITTKSIEELLKDVVLKGNDPMNIPINNADPAKNAYYQYLKYYYKATSHRDLIEKACPDLNDIRVSQSVVSRSIDLNKNDLSKLSQWMLDNGYEKEANRVSHIAKKFAQGKSAWTHSANIGRATIPAFVGAIVDAFIHPYECRYLTFREALAIMAMPEDFCLFDKNINTCKNHIAQNVCVSTSYEMVQEIISMMHGNRDMLEIGDNQYVIQDHRKGDTITIIKIE